MEQRVETDALDGQTTDQEPVKPIWEIIQERMRKLPGEELAKLPKDGAEQHDHYIYGVPKRGVE